jgi:hypothetical protein
MPRGDKSAYTDKQKRQAEHIEQGYEESGVPEEEAERRAWATVNAMTGGGKKSGSGRGKPINKAPARKGGKKGGQAAAKRSKAAKRVHFVTIGRIPYFERPILATTAEDFLPIWTESNAVHNRLVSNQSGHVLAGRGIPGFQIAAPSRTNDLIAVWAKCNAAHTGRMAAEGQQLLSGDRVPYFDSPVPATAYQALSI